MDQFDQLMTNCLKVEAFDRARAIRLFNRQFPALPVKNLGDLVYERVMSNFQFEGVTVATNEMVAHMREALRISKDQALTTGDWSQFTKLAALQAKMGGLEQVTKDQPPILHQSINITQTKQQLSSEEVLERVQQLQSELGIRGLPTSIGIPTTIQTDVPTVTVQPPSEATVGYAVQSQEHFYHRGEPLREDGNCYQRNA